MTTAVLSLRRTSFLVALGVAGWLFQPASILSQTLRPATQIDYNRDIRPILSDNCYACHGPDEKTRKAGFRLDTRQGAFAELRGGDRAIVPGKPAESILLTRIHCTEPGEQMPPPKSGKKLTDHQKELLRRWIEQGAVWAGHWAYIKPQRPAVPNVSQPSWVHTPIDAFVLARLDREGVRPSPEAGKITLLRRLYFDLIGLPPTWAEVSEYLNDTAPGAYERLVDRLFTSKHHGERLALYWLDLVRYADTGGYHSDNHRDIALYRDYVIDAFNSNKPFDRFTAEQLAGDMLPGATEETRIASGYNRLLMTTEEGGAQAKEYQAKYAADRVRNVSTVWLGATMGCAECHDHKFDPFGTKDFYRFASFFADIQEKPVGRQDQTLLPTQQQAAKLKEWDEKIAATQKLLQDQKGKPEEAATKKELTALQKQKETYQQTIRTTLVSIHTTPRMMRVLPRGNWLSDSGEVVTPGVPGSVAPLNVKDRQANRLDLAQWLTSRDNPLVARVLVNRLWKLFFGQGIVRTLDDFGSQGASPTHPELLDWLAVEFQESGWDVRRLIKLLVLSNTYRQASAVSEQLRQRDPGNELLTRQGRFRLDAEMIRDSALEISGLLSRKIGGPSVKPYQPAGYWAMLNFPKREWQNEKGDGLYRRGLYTYWCRTFPHPSLTAFDAPSREECTVDRPRSNTPLQALVLLNDPVYVEASRAFAERILREGGPSMDSRLQFAFRQALSRQVRPNEMAVLEPLYHRHLRQYKQKPDEARALMSVGERPMPADLDVAELAAWTSVARTLLNLHETITRN